MTYNTSTGIYTPASGATTAAAGQTIASATWNGIFTDLTTALTTLGKANILGVNSGINAVAFAPTFTAINFAASVSDAATFTIPVPSSLPGYSIRGLYIGNASASLGTVGISLFTAAAGGGTQVMSSTATTITSSLPNTANSMQVMVPGSTNTMMVKSSIIVMRIVASNATAGTADVMLQITPIF